MNSYYTITESIYEQLKLAGFRNVMLGEISEADLNRQTIAPYAVIIPQTSTIPMNVDVITLLIVGMDLVDFNKSDFREQEVSYYGTDNLGDVLCDIYNRLSLVNEYYKSAHNHYELEGVSSMDPFKERFESLWAGWSLTLTIKLASNVPIC
jgi:hypothetical protein